MRLSPYLLAIILLRSLLSHFTKEQPSKGLGNQQGFNIFQTESTYSGVWNVQHKQNTEAAALWSNDGVVPCILPWKPRLAFTIASLFKRLPETFSTHSLKHFGLSESGKRWLKARKHRCDWIHQNIPMHHSGQGLRKFYPLPKRNNKRNFSAVTI